MATVPQPPPASEVDEHHAPARPRPPPVEYDGADARPLQDLPEPACGRVALAIAGSMAIEGPVTRWVTAHRRHHAFSEKGGDPHSPWRYGTTVPGAVQGLWHAHIGWLFDVEQTDQQRFTP